MDLNIEVTGLTQIEEKESVSNSDTERVVTTKKEDAKQTSPVKQSAKDENDI
jgi:hypothetical protein